MIEDQDDGSTADGKAEVLKISFALAPATPFGKPT
jgi:hypothetical protein